MLVWLNGSSGIFAACVSPINTFPYSEDFETGAGSWTSGGINNDWSLGTPAKQYINSAASGINSWITGGLTVSFYQYGERSWVQSPCFDFSLLNYPVVSFMIFWETESQYDGGNFQYSLDGGLTWNNVGTVNEPADCYTQNWFNQPGINNLNSLAAVNHGWSGTSLPSSGSCQGGNGSGEWKLAKHCLKNLAHKPEVLFRFTFGSGTLCNDYDGIAFDDFRIEEAQPVIPSFNFSCTAPDEVEFTDATTGCPANFYWDFGDGVTSTQQHPLHVFAAPGVYQVQLVTGNACGAQDTSTRSITILDATVTATAESCAGFGDGTATVSVIPQGAYSYAWSTVPVQTDSTAVYLFAGAYSVTVSGANACSITETVLVQLSNQDFNAAVSSTETSCAGVNDGLAVLVTPNAFLYSYSWNTVPVQTTDTAFSLAPGSYTVIVTGPGICIPEVFNVDVLQGNAGNPGNFLGNDTATCPGSEILLHAGDFSAYTWEDGTNAAFKPVSSPGTYFVEVVTAAGCVGSDTILVAEKCLDDVLFPNSFTPNNDGVNDRFYAYGTGVRSFRLQVFDRWGEKIFETDSMEEGWDGTYSQHHVHDGIYACIVTYSMDGVNTKSKKGMVALFR